MATLWISTVKVVEPGPRGAYLPVFPEPAGASTVTFTTSAQSPTLDNSYIRFASDVDYHLEFGTNPTATTSSPKFFAGVEYFRFVRRGNKLAVYDGSS